MEALRKQHEKEKEEKDKALREENLCSAMNHLDTLNPGNVHTHFHGIVETAKIFDVCERTLRRQYTDHRSRTYAMPAAPASILDNTISDQFLDSLVTRCVNGGEKSLTVWKENENMLIEQHCGRTTFSDIVKRRKANSDAPLRLKLGRGDFIEPLLLQSIAQNTAKDLQGMYVYD